MGKGGREVGERGREVGVRGREVGNAYPPVHPLLIPYATKFKAWEWIGTRTVILP